MKRAGGLVLVIAACALAACQLVAGIQDRVLVAADDATTGTSSGTSSSTSSGGSSGSTGPGGSGGPEAGDGAGGANDPFDAAGDVSSEPSQDDATVAADAQADSSSATPDSSGALDAGPPVDGGSSADAGGIVDASPVDAAFAGTPCSQVTSYVFCDDFDSVTDATTGWSWTSFSLDGGSIQLEQDAPATPPNSVAVVVPPVSGSYQLGKVLGTLSNFTLSFDLRLDVDSLDEIPYAIIAQMNFTQSDGGTGTFNFALGSGASCAFQVFINGAQTFMAVPVPPVRQWIHVTLTYDPGTGATITQNGVAVGGDAGAGIVMAPGAATLIIGDVFVAPPQSGTLTYSMDDVVLQGTE